MVNKRNDMVVESLVESWYADYGNGNETTYTVEGDPVKYIATTAAAAAVNDLQKAANRRGYKDYSRIITLDCQKFKVTTVKDHVNIGVYDPVHGKYPNSEYQYEKINAHHIQTKQEFVDFLKNVDSNANPATIGQHFISKEKWEAMSMFNVKMPFKVLPERKSVWYSTKVLVNDLNVKTFAEKYGNSVEAVADTITHKLESDTVPTEVYGGTMTYSELFRKCVWRDIKFSVVTGEWDNSNSRKATRCCIEGTIGADEFGDLISRVNARADMPQVILAAKAKYAAVKAQYDKFVEKKAQEKAYADAHSSEFLHFGTNSEGGISEDFFAMCRADSQSGLKSTDTGRCQSRTMSDKYRFTYSVDSSD